MSSRKTRCILQYSNKNRPNDRVACEDESDQLSSVIANEGNERNNARANYECQITIDAPLTISRPSRPHFTRAHGNVADLAQNSFGATFKNLLKYCILKLTIFKSNRIRGKELNNALLLITTMSCVTRKSRETGSCAVLTPSGNVNCSRENYFGFPRTRRRESVTIPCTYIHQPGFFRDNSEMRVYNVVLKLLRAQR